MFAKYKLNFTNLDEIITFHREGAEEGATINFRDGSGHQVGKGEADAIARGLREIIKRDAAVELVVVDDATEPPTAMPPAE